MIGKVSTAVAVALLLAATPAFAQDGPPPGGASGSGSGARSGSGGGGGKRLTVSPYIELSQVLTADLQTGDVLTYSSVAAGVDASIQTRRVAINISARYEHQFTYDSQSSDSDIVTGLANVQVRVARGLTLDAGGIATRTRNDIRGAAPIILGNDDPNISKLYAGYVGPTLSTNVGPIGIGASYRFGYTKVTSPGPTGVVAGSPRLDYFDDSKDHMATASAGWESGTLMPFGFTVSGGWTRSDQNQLSSRFEGLYGRADAVMPLSGTFAIQGGVGYEKIQSSSRDPLLDINGQPVTDSRGRFVTDPNSPRRIAYNTDGIYWDAGAVWRPSPRTTLQARVGRRYNSWSYTGSLSYAPSPGVGLQIGVYDSVDTFGNQLQRGLKGLPTEFTQTRDMLASQFSGCTFGTTGGGATGACLNSVFQSVSTATYRSRGVDGVITMSRGGTTLGFGAGYANRKFYAPNSPGVAIIGTSDQSYYAQMFYTAPIGARASVSANVFANYFDSGIAPGIWSAGTTGSLSRSFGRLSASASLGAYVFKQDGQDDQANGQASVGARYQF